MLRSFVAVFPELSLLVTVATAKPCCDPVSVGVGLVGGGGGKDVDYLEVGDAYQ